MKQGLQLKLSQQLAMTPQLQQAIRLLQLSTLELQQEIQTALETNPLLEIQDDLGEIDISLNEQQPNDEKDSVDLFEQNTLSDELSLDTSWEHLYSAETSQITPSNFSDETLFSTVSEDLSLQQHLLWQASLVSFNETEMAIATTLIDAIDPQGYLTQSLAELRLAIDIDGLELAHIEHVLSRIQQFDPVGVAARDLAECLNLQLAYYENQTPSLTLAKVIVNKHLDLLAHHDFRTLSKLTKQKEPPLKAAVALIQSLDPRPGESIQCNSSHYVIPDVLVTKTQGIWRCELNNDSLPSININPYYLSLSQNKKGSEETQFVQQHLQDANWFLKSLQSRHDTLFAVSQAIVNAQQAFFEKGEEFMRPLILSDIAEKVDMHESTISRVTTQKYLHCPRGIFELKYFFSSHLTTEAGGEASSTAIRAVIKRLVAEENSKKPLSDSKLTQLLNEEGFQVARRTVAKYRESLGIAASSLRKQL